MIEAGISAGLAEDLWVGDMDPEGKRRTFTAIFRVMTVASLVSRRSRP
jgi:hypothetical protein